jgi:putative DNA primase/helicase
MRLASVNGPDNPLDDRSPPWEGVDIPDGFELTTHGVARTNSRQGPTLVSGPAWVSAKTRACDGRGWGSQICWIDQDGQHRELAVPNGALHGGPQSAVIGDLADGGLQIIPGQERHLMTYLGSFRPLARLRATDRTGWLNPDRPGPLAFVLPDRVIGQDLPETVVFQPEHHSPSAKTLGQRGDERDWHDHIGRFCIENPILITAVGAALAAPLVPFTPLGSFGLHLYGSSSRGKTTAAQVGASVWGCGADPATSLNSSIQRWNTTANALEGLAAAHNDGLLVLDEIGTFTGRDFGALVYNLTGGLGKARMNDRITLRAFHQWHLVALSTGELSIAARISEEGRQIKAGQINRFLDIPASDRIIREGHGLTPAERAEQLKTAAGQTYGGLGPRFIETLIERDRTAPRIELTVLPRVEKLTAALAGEYRLEAHQRRGLARFALLAAALELAIELDVLPWPPEAPLAAIREIATLWLQNDTSDAARVIRSICHFIHRYRGSKIVDTRDEAGGSNPRTPEIAGYYLPHLEGYAFTPEGLRDASGGFDPKNAAAILQENGLLKVPEVNRLQTKVQIPGINGRPRMYIVKDLILHDRTP